MNPPPNLPEKALSRAIKKINNSLAGANLALSRPIQSKSTLSQSVQSLSFCTENTVYYNKKAELLMQTAQITYDKKKKEGKFQLTGEDAIKLFNAKIDPSTFTPLLPTKDAEAIQIAMEAYQKIQEIRKEDEDQHPIKPNEVKEAIGEENWKRLEEAVNEAVNRSVLEMKGIEEGRWGEKEYGEGISKIEQDYFGKIQYLPIASLPKDSFQKLDALAIENNLNPFNFVNGLINNQIKDEKILKKINDDAELKQAVENAREEAQKLQEEKEEKLSNWKELTKDFLNRKNIDEYNSFKQDPQQKEESSEQPEAVPSQ